MGFNSDIGTIYCWEIHLANGDAGGSCYSTTADVVVASQTGNAFGCRLRLSGVQPDCTASGECRAVCSACGVRTLVGDDRGVLWSHWRPDCSTVVPRARYCGLAQRAAGSGLLGVTQKPDCARGGGARQWCYRAPRDAARAPSDGQPPARAVSGGVRVPCPICRDHRCRPLARTFEIRGAASGIAQHCLPRRAPAARSGRPTVARAAHHGTESARERRRSGRAWRPSAAASLHVRPTWACWGHLRWRSRHRFLDPFLPAVRGQAVAVRVPGRLRPDSVPHLPWEVLRAGCLFAALVCV